MRLKNFEFLISPSGGFDIHVRQNSAENAPEIAYLHISEEEMYEILASLELTSDLDDEDLFEDVESEDSEDEEEA